MPRFIVPIKYTFSGHFEVEAETIDQARQIVKRDCGVVIENAHTSNDEQVTDWNFDLHPTKYNFGIIRKKGAKNEK